MSADLEVFLEFLERLQAVEDCWADTDAVFTWVAHRTWVGWWSGVGGSSTRVYVERAGPQMRAHP